MSGVCPPKQFEQARVVVFAADHGVARAGVSAYPPEVTAQMVANIDAGGAAINVLAELAGAGVRLVDVAVDTDAPGTHKVRRSSENIAVADALSEDEVAAAVAAGRDIADEEVDSGADLLIAGDMGIGNTTAATVLVCALTNTEPVAAIGRGTGIDDAGWIRKTAAVRDALYRVHPVRSDPVAVLRVGGGADLAAMAGFLAQAALRRTPVLLDGMVVTSAALVAERLAPGRARGGRLGTGPPNPPTPWRWPSWNSNPSSTSGCAWVRAPARWSHCPSSGPRSPRWRRWPPSTRLACPAAPTRDRLADNRFHVLHSPAAAVGHTVRPGCGDGPAGGGRGAGCARGRGGLGCG